MRKVGVAAERPRVRLRESYGVTGDADIMDRIYKQKETKSAKALRNQVRSEFIFVFFVIFC
jgi:hypothetical protein